MLIAMDAITEVPLPVNEPVQEFAPDHLSVHAWPMP